MRCSSLYGAKAVVTRYFCIVHVTSSLPPFRENRFTVSRMPIFSMRISEQTDGTPGVLQPPPDPADGKLFQSFYTLCCGNTIILQLQLSKSIYIQLAYEPCVEIAEFQNSSSRIINYQPLISKWQQVASPQDLPTPYHCKVVDCAYTSQNFTAEKTVLLACGLWRHAATWPTMNAELGRGSGSTPSTRESCFQTSKERSHWQAHLEWICLHRASFLLKAAAFLLKNLCNNCRNVQVIVIHCSDRQNMSNWCRNATECWILAILAPPPHCLLQLSICVSMTPRKLLVHLNPAELHST